MQPTTEQEEISLLEEVRSIWTSKASSTRTKTATRRVSSRLTSSPSTESHKTRSVCAVNWKKKGEPTFNRKQYYVHYLLVQGPGADGLGFWHLIVVIVARNLHSSRSWTQERW